MKIRHIIFSWLPVCALFLVLEMILRLIGFQYSDTPLVTKNSNPISESLADIAASRQSKHFDIKGVPIKKDRYQFWVPTKDYFKGYSLEKPPGVRRIVTLGCSCTWGCEGTAESYPSYLQALLNKGNLPHKYEVLNAGVSGYTSFQGLQRLKRVVFQYHPDIVTIYFGWNDHWFAQTEDKNIRIRGAFEVAVLNFVELFRVYQAAHYLWDKLSGKKIQALDQVWLSFRVELPDYEANLNEMIRLIREHHAVPVLITAPTDPSKLRPSWVFPVTDTGALAGVHALYNSVVRKVAAASNVPIIDLAGDVEFLADNDPKHTAMIFSDGIHYRGV